VGMGVVLALTLALALAAAIGVSAQTNKLMDPSRFTETAPDVFRARFDTSAGEFVIKVTRAWAPNGADRFYNLVKNGFYDEARFFRAVPNFMVQFGLHANPTITKVWQGARIPPDKVTQSNKKGFITFAMGATPDTRTTQVFINLVANERLDGMGFAPFGRVRELDVAQQLFSGYGEGAPMGSGPMQQRIQREGNTYLKAEFPKLDYIERATIESEARAPLKQRELPPRTGQ